jgi:nucleoside-diphosphate-sugar epimerase
VRQRALVPGSAGLIGAAVARAIARRWEVVGVDARPGRWTSVIADLDAAALDRLVASATAIVHVAALHAPHVGVEPERAFVRTNVTLTARLLDAASAAGVRRFVLASTTSVYGHSLEPSGGGAVWVDESLRCRPRDVYDETKLAAEDLVRSAHGPELRTLTLRIARCFPEPPRTMAVHRLCRGVDVRDSPP